MERGSFALFVSYLKGGVGESVTWWTGMWGPYRESPEVGDRVILSLPSGVDMGIQARCS